MVRVVRQERQDQVVLVVLRVHLEMVHQVQVEPQEVLGHLALQEPLV